MKYSFKTDGGDGWMFSARHFDTSEQAVNALSEWLFVCAQNNFFPAVRIVCIDEKGRFV